MWNFVVWTLVRGKLPWIIASLSIISPLMLTIQSFITKVHTQQMTYSFLSWLILNAKFLTFLISNYCSKEEICSHLPVMHYLSQFCLLRYSYILCNYFFSLVIVLPSYILSGKTALTSLKATSLLHFKIFFFWKHKMNKSITLTQGKETYSGPDFCLPSRGE